MSGGQVFPTCLNCSSKVHEPLPMSWLPVDCGVGGWEGRPCEKLGMIGEPGKLVRNELLLPPACLRNASKAGRPCRLPRWFKSRSILGTGWVGRRSLRMPMVGICILGSCSSSECSSSRCWGWSWRRSVPLSPGLSGSGSDTALRGD